MADWRVTDPLVAAAVKAGGLLSNVLPQGMMTPARILDETVSGNQKSITEQDLTPEQRKFLKDLIAYKEDYAKKTETPSGSINYDCSACCCVFIFISIVKLNEIIAIFA